MRCGNCGLNYDAAGTYASGGSCPGCSAQMTPKDVFSETVGRVQPSSGAPALSAGGWGGRPRYRVGHGIGEILEATFRTWGKTILPNGLLNLIPLALTIPVAIASFFAFGLIGAATNGDSSAPIIGVVVLFAVVTYIAHMSAYLGSFVILDDAVREQGDENPVTAFSHGVRKVPAMAIAAGLMTLLLGVLYAIPVVGAALVNDTAGLVVACLMSLPLMYLGARLSLTFPAMMIEELGPIESMVRSFDLTRGNLLTMFVSSVAMGGVLFAIFAFVVMFSFFPLVGMMASIGGMLVLNTLSASFTFAVFASFRDANENSIHGEV